MNKKEEFVVNDKSYLVVQPCGMLYSQGREYFLLHPYPVAADWEFMADRFVCVPNKNLGQLENGSIIHPFARHVVTSAYAIDYAPDMPWITIEKLDVDDLSETEWKEFVIYEMVVEEDVEPESRLTRDVNDLLREAQEDLEDDGFPL